ncbi:type II toxin-antitoxin system ParD family antitoxin [Roseomonas populi]|uniref:Type II toxin-antitoxin system ParD family antitoxin n=1 Tax=Roseomonas populi TaxID=3121582 RepID=A0ABT1X4Z8_9PROT|nr:type II toxin-antitoxin system ParD family antitoxin [Roseomonas pecuniae]MCR0982794.1 type II toxin-antitoxin system ParD family antitoxin [Roseomonas pecuniae]
MAVRRTITVSITPQQDDLLRKCVSSGRFGSVSEVMRAALRLLERDEAASAAPAPKLPGDLTANV